MPGSERSPPRLAVAILRSVLRPDIVCESIVEELSEEFVERSGSRLRASLWFWRAALGVAVRRIFSDPFDRHVVAARRGHRAHGKMGGAGAMNLWERGAMMRSELKAAVRGLGRARIFTVAAVLTLALGIGSAAGIYTLVDSVVLEPLPYPQSERLVDIYSTVPGMGFDRWEVTQAGYFLFRGSARTLESVGAFRAGEITVESDVGAERVPGAVVTADLLEVLGARPVVGRLIDEGDVLPGGAPLALLGYDHWVSRHGADPEVVGRSVSIAGAPRQIVGVVEADFELPGTPVDILLPFRMDPGATPNDSHSIRVLGRMSPSADLAAVQEDLDGLTAQFPDLFPQAYSGAWMEEAEFRTVAQPLHDLVVDAGTRRALWILMGAVVVVLLIAVANVANLHLVWNLGRRGEVAVRRAMGATRRDLLRGFLAETMLIAGSGTVLGVVGAALGLRLLRANAAAELPRIDAVSVDASVILVAGGVALAVAWALGVMPIVRLKGAVSMGALLGVGRGGMEGGAQRSLRGALVVVQVALAMMLLTSSGLMVRSFQALIRVDPGFDASGVVAVDLALSGGRYPTQAGVHAFYRDLIRNVEALPGVGRAGAASSVPLESGLGCYSLWSEARPNEDQPPCILLHVTTAGYFEAMGMELADGRWLEPGEDGDGSGPLIVTKALAERLWPERSALGEGASIHGYRNPWFRVVGVTEDLLAEGLDQPATAAVFLPMVSPRGARQHLMHRSGMTLVVRTSSTEPLTLVPSLRRLVAELDPTVAVANPRLMDTVVADTRADTTLAMLLLAAAAAVALLLGSVDLYAVIAHGVGRRTREIGLRMALGAEGRRVWLGVLASSSKLVALGLVIGIAGSLAGTRLLRTLLFQVSPTDVVTLVVVSGVLLVVTGIAAFVPAYRAARVDPVVALRGES